MSSSAHYLCPKWASSVMLRIPFLSPLPHWAGQRSTKGVWSNCPLEKALCWKREQWSPLRDHCRLFPMTFRCKMPEQLREQESGLHGLHTPPVQLARDWYTFSWRQQELEHCLESLNTKGGLWNNLHKWMTSLSFHEKGAGMDLERGRFLSFSKASDLNGILWKRELQECRRSCSLSVLLSSLYVELSY